MSVIQSTVSNLVHLDLLGYVTSTVPPRGLCRQSPLVHRSSKHPDTTQHHSLLSRLLGMFSRLPQRRTLHPAPSYSPTRQLSSCFQALSVARTAAHCRISIATKTFRASDVRPKACSPGKETRACCERQGGGSIFGNRKAVARFIMTSACCPSTNNLPVQVFRGQSNDLSPSI